MYYLIFGIFYLLSLLPFWVLYFFSDVAAYVLYAVVRYRRQTVMENISGSFPNNTARQNKKIAQHFYRNFTDNWIETIKLMTLSKEAILQRNTGNAKLLQQLHAEGKTISTICGHFFNWEYLNIYLSLLWPGEMLTVYMPLSDKPMNRLFLYIRGRFGTNLMSATTLNKEIIPWRHKQYLIGLVADQSPANPLNAFWLLFLHRPSAVLTGPERNAQVLAQVPVYVKVARPKRGHYQYHFSLLLNETENAKEKGLITRKITRLTEVNIQEQPTLYLWSHRRWKHSWHPDYQSLWIDKSPCPL